MTPVAPKIAVTIRLVKARTGQAHVHHGSDDVDIVKCLTSLPIVYDDKNPATYWTLTAI
jgi:hypothetical protein